MNKLKICAALLSLSTLFSCGCSKESNNYSSSILQQQEERKASKGVSNKVDATLYALENIDNYKSINYDSDKIVIVCPEIFVGNAITAASDINEILSEKYEINKEVIFVGIDDTVSYQDKLSKYIDEGGQIDIISTGYNVSGYGAINHSCGTYQDFVDNGWLIDLTGYLNGSGGEQLKNIYSDRQWKSLSINNKIYGVNGNQMLGNGQVLSFNTKVCEENGIDLADYDGSFKQIKEWCDIIKSHNVDCDYFYGGISGISDIAELAGMLPDYQLASYGIGVYQTENGLKAVNIYEDGNVRKLISELSDLYASGYIFDPTVNEASGVNLVMNVSSMYADGQTDETTVTNKNWITPYSQNVNNFVCGICALSEDTDTAFKVLSALYSDKDLSNLLQYGTDKISDITEEQYESIYAMCSIGNNMITFPNKFNGETDNKTVEIEEYNESVKDNPLLGFRLDLSKADFNTLYEINSQGENIFMGYCGDDWESCLNKISEQLETAGINKTIDEVNLQLEKFYESNPN